MAKRLLPLLLASIIPIMVAAVGTASSGTSTAKVSSPATTHVMTVATGVETFRGYEGAPDFEVVSRKKKLRLYPCTLCHRFLPTKSTPRKLVTALPHPNSIQHGKGRMWCLDCHHEGDKNLLRTIQGEKIDFDQEHLLCGQCHHNRHKDWYFGAHGKRLDNWRGKRKIVLCTHCHNPHNVVLRSRKPQEKPPVRVGLDPMPPYEVKKKRSWEVR